MDLVILVHKYFLKSNVLIFLVKMSTVLIVDDILCLSENDMSRINHMNT